VIAAGKPATMRLVLSVFGSGGGVRGRYKDVALHYRLVGDSTFRRAVTPPPRPIDRKRESYDFVIPPFPQGTRGELEYFFVAHLDGHQGPAIEGIKKIRVE